MRVRRRRKSEKTKGSNWKGVYWQNEGVEVEQRGLKGKTREGKEENETKKGKPNGENDENVGRKENGRSWHNLLGRQTGADEGLTKNNYEGSLKIINKPHLGESLISPKYEKGRPVLWLNVTKVLNLILITLFSTHRNFLTNLRSYKRNHRVLVGRFFKCLFNPLTMLRVLDTKLHPAQLCKWKEFLINSLKDGRIRSLLATTTCNVKTPKKLITTSYGKHFLEFTIYFITKAVFENSLLK